VSNTTNYVTLLPSRTEAEAHLTDLLTKSIRAELANERIVRQQRGLAEPTIDDELSIARSIIADERHRGPDEGAVAYELEVEDFDRIADAVVAGVLGLGRLQRLLEDPDISDIHVRGAAPVWIKWRNGTRTCVEPIVDSDEELVELIRRAATRLVRSIFSCLTGRDSSPRWPSPNTRA